MTHLEDVLKTFWKRLEDILRTSRRLLGKTSWRFLEDNTSWKTSWRRLEDFLVRRLEDVLKTRHLEKVLKTSWRRITKTDIFVLIKTFWRRLLKTHDQGEYIRLDHDALKTSFEDLRRQNEDERRQNIFKMSSPRRMFAMYIHIYI